MKQDTPPTPPGYIRIGRVPERYGISGSFLRKEWNAGRGPRYSKISRVTLIKVADLEAWIAQHARGPEAV